MERSGIPATNIIVVVVKKQKRWDYAALHPSLHALWEFRLRFEMYGGWFFLGCKRIIHLVGACCNCC